MNLPSITIKPELGQGIYSIPDAATILDIPVTKVRTWVNKYCELEFGKAMKVEEAYTWGNQREKALHFLTLIEIIAVNSFREIGVSFSKIKLAHEVLENLLSTPYPFAHAGLMSDGKRIFYSLETSLLEIDRKKQLYFAELIAPYCKKIDFHENSKLAERYWPLGKDRKIVVDPHHSFGQPVITGTNTTAEAVINMLKAGDSPVLIASVYELNLNDVEDVQAFMKRSAA